MVDLLASLPSHLKWVPGSGRPAGWGTLAAVPAMVLDSVLCPERHVRLKVRESSPYVCSDGHSTINHDDDDPERLPCVVFWPSGSVDEGYEEDEEEEEEGGRSGGGGGAAGGSGGGGGRDSGDTGGGGDEWVDPPQAARPRWDSLGTASWVQLRMLVDECEADSYGRELCRPPLRSGPLTLRQFMQVRH